MPMCPFCLAHSLLYLYWLATRFGINNDHQHRFLSHLLERPSIDVCIIVMSDVIFQVKQAKCEVSEGKEKKKTKKKACRDLLGAKNYTTVRAREQKNRNSNTRNANDEERHHWTCTRSVSMVKAGEKFSSVLFLFVLFCFPSGQIIIDVWLRCFV